MGEQILPTIAAFDQEGSVLAIVYRGRSISLWDIEERYAMGRLVRNVAAKEAVLEVDIITGFRRMLVVKSLCSTHLCIF